MKKRVIPEMVSKKRMKQDKRRERRLLRRKKAAVFIVVFFSVVGLLKVDAACGEQLDRPSLLNVRILRENSETVSFSMLGKTAYLDVDELKDRWAELAEHVKVLSYKSVRAGE